MKNFVFLKSGLMIETPDNAQELTNKIAVWAPNELISVICRLTDNRTWEVYEAGWSFIRWEVAWIVDIEWGTIVENLRQPMLQSQEDVDAIVEWLKQEQWIKEETEADKPRENYTREELIKMYIEKFEKKPNHMLSNEKLYKKIFEDA